MQTQWRDVLDHVTAELKAMVNKLDARLTEKYTAESKDKP